MQRGKSARKEKTDDAVLAAAPDASKPAAPAAGSAAPALPLTTPLGLPAAREEQWVAPYEHVVIGCILLVALATRYYGLTDPAGVVRARRAAALPCAAALLPTPLPFPFLSSTATGVRRVPLWALRQPVLRAHVPL